jgi:CubicO group peptidase (beta-lactamase class C family)
VLILFYYDFRDVDTFVLKYFIRRMVYMNSAKLSKSKIILAIVFFLFSHSGFGQQTAAIQANSAKELVGLWEAKRRFGPDVRGTLVIRKTSGDWQAEIAGRFAPVKLDGDSISFELTDGKGKFQGKFDARRAKIVGHWIQPTGIEIGALASPVTLARFGRDGWLGDVVPLDDAMSFYLMIKSREDGSTGAFLRNPERNLGWTQYRVDRLEREGESVKLLAANKGNEKGRVLAEGFYRDGILTINIPRRGGSYDFKRLEATESSDFYPRGRPAAAYRYAPPPAFGDGWQTASLEDVGISRAGIEKFIQTVINTPIDSVNSQEDHGILIARHGKLVLEEYFHGESRDKPHDTRSASKSVASDLTGAAILSGIPVKTTDFVYRAMNGGEFPANLEPRKRALTLEHLLTMSSGLDCDDWSSAEESPGYEDNFWDQDKEPDFYKWTLALNMARQPGEKAVYCSAGANLVGGVVARAARRSTQELFQKLLAEPLGIKRYYLPLSPAGDYTMSGSARFQPRDFMKLGQLHLNGGAWKGRKIFTPEWSRRATSHLVEFTAGSRTFQYGYLWWVKDYAYRGRTVQAYFASGLGGQIVMAIPDLDLVLAFYAGSYADAGGSKATNVYVPEYILPAINK